MLLTPELAEVIGLNLGDGCISRSISKGRSYFQVAFTAGPDGYWYYQSFVQPTIEKAFAVAGSLYLRNDNTTRYHISGTKLANYLIGLGLPVGKKRDAEIPKAILEQGLVVHFIGESIMRKGPYTGDTPKCTIVTLGYIATYW